MRVSQPPSSRRKEYSDATRSALLDSGEELFLREGFNATGVEAIAQIARVTRGAFYHHFDDKQVLFDAVVVRLQAQTAVAIERHAAMKTDPWDRLIAGIEAYLDACVEPAYRRLVIQEGIAVLGLARYVEIEDAYPLGLLGRAVSALQASGYLRVPDTGLFTRMVGGMICEVALATAEESVIMHRREAGMEIVNRALDAFRCEPSARRRV